MSVPIPDTALLQPTYTVPPSLDPREPPPPAITSPGGHIQTSRNRSTGTPRAPRTPTRSPVRSAASSRATSPVRSGLDRDQGSLDASHSNVLHAHKPGIRSRPTSSRGASPAIQSASSSRRSSGNGSYPPMLAPNSIDAALASSGVKGGVLHNSHLPTSPLSEQETSPPISPLDGLAGPTSSLDPTQQSRPLSGTISPRARPSSHATRPGHAPSDGSHGAASAFLRPVSPALSASASISDSMIFERDIESPLPPPIPASVLEHRPSSRKGSRASGLHVPHGEHGSSTGHSLAHSQTHSYSNLHQHYTHGDFLESKIPTVLDDAIEALTALSESEKRLQASGAAARTRLVDIEVESPVPVPLNWSSPTVPGGRTSATPRHTSNSGSRPVSPFRSGIASPRESHPTSPLLSAERPGLVNRASSVGPLLPGAFPSDEERSSDSWRRKIQDWIGPKGLEDAPPVPSGEGDGVGDQMKDLSLENQEHPQPSSTPLRVLPATILPPSGDRHRISFVSYNDILTSHPLRVDPLSDLTSGASGEPDHLPGTVSPALGMLPSARSLSPGAMGGVSRSVSLSRGARASPAPRDASSSTHGAGAGPSAIPTSIQDRLGISAHAGDRAKGEWEKEGLGKGLQERLEELITDDRGS
ncbi:hypothetical protein NliqN6_0858 [Naganishia liquefaciens]|uniref:Uncharacterized protein n=1 Tax=Naganishia liquefaciens TaxID=104408 RepID=A0A8H3TPC0_9TREE|nr:hypothetical protein NliqN6_0858 [Naganishia liquefaciens]